MADLTVIEAMPGDLERLVPLVADFHAFEHVTMTDTARRRAVANLLDDPKLGRIWRIELDAVLIGYIAIGFGYSIEFGGRDGFLDEFYLTKAHRGRGLGRQVLRQVKDQLPRHGVHALHLEVHPDNARAQGLYAAEGFQLRDYRLMSLAVENAGDAA